jgi:hypothetical protein
MNSRCGSNSSTNSSRPARAAVQALQAATGGGGLHLLLQHLGWTATKPTPGQHLLCRRPPQQQGQAHGGRLRQQHLAVVSTHSFRLHGQCQSWPMTPPPQGAGGTQRPSAQPQPSQHQQQEQQQVVGPTGPTTPGTSTSSHNSSNSMHPSTTHPWTVSQRPASTQPVLWPLPTCAWALGCYYSRARAPQQPPRQAASQQLAWLSVMSTYLQCRTVGCSSRPLLCRRWGRPLRTSTSQMQWSFSL